MNKIFKRVVSAVTAAITLTAVFVFGVPKLTARAAASGDGWTLDNSGKLTIMNDQGMKMWHNTGNANYRDNVKSVIINSGVTYIAEIAFYFCKNLTSVTIPDSVTTIYVSKIEPHKIKKRSGKYRRGGALPPRLFTSEYQHRTAQTGYPPPVPYPEFLKQTSTTSQYPQQSFSSSDNEHSVPCTRGYRFARSDRFCIFSHNSVLNRHCGKSCQTRRQAGCRSMYNTMNL